MEKGTLVTVIGNFQGVVPVGEYIGKTENHYVIRKQVNGIDTLVTYPLRNVRLEEVK
jgi:hypothetical protein